MFDLIRFIIWLAGLAVVGYFLTGFFGYEINTEYFKEQRPTCEERLRQCQKDLIQSGINGVKEKCDWKCVDPKLLIRKNQE